MALFCPVIPDTKKLFLSDFLQQPLVFKKILTVFLPPFGKTPEPRAGKLRALITVSDSFLFTAEMVTGAFFTPVRKSCAGTAVLFPDKIRTPPAKTAAGRDAPGIVLYSAQETTSGK